ncbi:MAG: thioesterase family protein [Phototrophicaceae bacterium]
MSENPKEQRREHYPHFLTIPTRWRDVDMYQHVNNVVFYAYFDTVIGAYLIKEGGLDYENGETIGFAVETHCQFLQQVRFPDVLEAGLRVGKLGNSSCRYEIGIFKEDNIEPVAVGHFVHVFVNRQTTRPTPIIGQLRAALEKLQLPQV